MANIFVERIASTDPGYVAGDLSLYPAAQDDAYQLYTVANNAVTVTTQSASYNSPYFIVQSTAGFPDEGLIRVGTEAVYYEQRTPNSFRLLQRGFCGSRQEAWNIGTTITAAVFAEPHNSVKDALINIETNLGVSVNPAATSLNGLLEALETRFLAPRPVFQAAPRAGGAPLTVKFQNFSIGDARYYWDFGDGGTSTDSAPTHTYQGNGTYTVQLNMITTLNAQGFATKTGYIEVSDDYLPAFFYYEPSTGPVSTQFSFVDQSDGEITARYWQWGDGNTTAVTDPDNHSATYTYSAAGTYYPTVMLVYSDGTRRIINPPDPLIVTS